jgi:hypothetical protein
LLFLIPGADPQPTHSQPVTTQPAAGSELAFEERLWAVERDVAAIRHLIVTGEVKPSVAPPRGASGDKDDRVDRRLDGLEAGEADTQTLELRVRELERLVGGPDRNLVTQSPSGIQTQVEALERRVDRLERSFRDLERDVERLERRTERPGRP